MALELNGTTGVSLVQDGVITDANLPAGSVLQVIYSTAGASTTGTTINTWVDTTATASITPSSTSNKILVTAWGGAYYNNTNSYPTIKFGFKRDSTHIFDGAQVFYLDNRSSGTLFGQQLVQGTCCYLDSPATTSSTTYTLQYYFNRVSGTGVGGVENPLGITLMEIAA